MQISKEKKIVPIQSDWIFKLLSKNILRLHEHGLIRLFNLDVEKTHSTFNKPIFFQSLIASEFYQELFFDHYSQTSKGKHGPFLTRNINYEDFSRQSNNFFIEDFIQILSSPKWGCPPINPSNLDKVKDVIPSLIFENSNIFFLDKCRTFNNSSNEAKIYEHEWSHNLSSFYEFVIYNPDTNKIHLLLLTYE